MAEKERESVLSEARTQTQFLDSPSLRKTLTKSDFRLKDLKTGILSVFLCLPARHMDTHDRWMRVIINLAVGALEPRRGEHRPAQAPVLLLLEEFPVLKHMEKLEAAAGQLAGSGVRMWAIVQNLGQIKRHYKDGSETFVANAGVMTAFSNADLETLQYLRGKLGNVPMLLNRNSGASSSALLSGARPLQEDLRDAALLEVDELSRAFDRDNCGRWSWPQARRRWWCSACCISGMRCLRECSMRDVSDDARQRSSRSEASTPMRESFGWSAVFRRARSVILSRDAPTEATHGDV
jgi:type IV secretion system protein VirD4